VSQVERFFAAVGGLLGYGLGRLAPEPAPGRTKKDKRGVTLRRNPGFNGPRRYKRKRG
jgi:hypothetical protein